MKHRLHAVLGASLLLCLPFSGLTPAQDPAQEDLVSRAYNVRHLDAHDGLMVAHQVCLDRRGDVGTCRFEVTRPGWFVYNTDAATQDAITQALAREDVPRRSLTLDLSLIMADNTSEAPLTLKGGEAQALADLRQLLPYQGYRLLESGRLRIQDRGQIHMGSMPSYAAEFRLGKQVPAGSDLVKFESFELIHTHLVPGGDSGAGDTTTDVILRTGFTMEVGETVVVGTSRLNGSDEALIVLLTASR